MIEKLRDCFDEMVVYKDLKKSNFFSALGLPSFLRDWLLKKFADDDGNLDVEELTDFIRTYLPNKEEWIKIKDRIINDNERVKLLTKISVDISIKTGEITFSLPDFGLTNKETMIDNSTWEQYRGELVSGQEVWGVVELGYRPPDDTVKPKILGKIKLTGFTNFCPYTIDLDYYKDVRNEFTTSEWIDVLLGAIDYNAAGYENEEQKLAMLTRILPFVEKRLNLIELAPKGTGKSYVFGHVSKYGLLTDGGKVTRAKMFYDIGKRTPGLVSSYDYVAFDEIQSIKFTDAMDDNFNTSLALTALYDLMKVINRDLRNKNITGKELEKRLDEVGITVNKNTIPFDTEKPTITSGIRIGTPAVTTRGFKEEEMKQIANLINMTVSEFETKKEEIQQKVKNICKFSCNKCFFVLLY